MEKNYDYEAIRKILIEYYTFVARSGHKIAYLDVLEVEKATNEELLELAVRNSLKLDKYLITNNKTR